MAIQQLTQPIINPISAFDSTRAHTISFVVIGGAQVIGNRLVISDNQTGKEVYNKIQSTMKLEHLIPANTLTNGGYYNAVVYTIDSGNNESVASTPVPFYCYSQPNLTIDNIPVSETIENGTYKFIGSYLQQENELLNSYQYTLYDSNSDVLSQSPLIYYNTDSSLSYTFVGMSNDTSYYIELSGETVNGTKITSGLKYFTVRYIQPASFAICDLVNNCENGYIQISSNVVAIDGKSNPTPPIYIDDKEVDLRDPDSWVEWNSGFRIQDDFTMRVWGRDFNDYQNIITLTNDINTSATPNKIELKWMVGDVIKTLPNYTTVEGENINILNAEVAKIENLSIGGNSEQEKKDMIDFGIDKFLTINTEETLPLSVTIFGNQEQKIQAGSYKEQEGENIYITDVDSSQPADIIIKGNNYQETREGYNLLDFNVTQDGRVTVNNDGTITINGTGGFSIKFREFEFKKGATYKTKATLVSGTYTSSDPNHIGIMTPYGNNVWLANDIFNTYTFLEDKVRSGMWVGENCVFNNATFKIYSYEGTEDKEFEQYGASPSPDYPGEIETVGSNLNLINKENVTNIYFNQTQIIIGATSKTIVEKCSPKTTYTISKMKSTKFRVCTTNVFPAANVTMSDYVYNDTGDKITIKTSDNANYICIYFYDSYSDKLTEQEILNTLKLEKGTVATPYSSYNQGSVEIKKSNNDNTQSQSVIMPIQQEMLEGDYIKDVEHHEWGKLIFNENSDMECTHSDKTFQFRFLKHLEGTGATTKVICNMAKYWNVGAWGENGCFVSYNGYFCILCKENEFGFNADMTTDEAIAHFKTILANSKLIVYYKLATPVNLELTEGQKEAKIKLTNMTLYQGFTNITNQSSYPAILDLKYNIVREMPSPDYPSPIRTVGDNINLFNYNDKKNVNSSYSTDEEGWITLDYNSVATSSIFFNYFTNNLTFKEGKEYSLFLEIKNVTGTGYIYVCSADANSQMANAWVTNFSAMTDGGVYKKNVTTKNNFSQSIYGLRTYCTFNAGDHGSITFRISVLENTDIGVDNFVYSNYNQGSVEVKIENKNILPNNYITQTKNGVTLTNNGDGTITLNGTATAKTYFFPPASGYISLDLDGDYTFSANTYNNLRYSLYYSSTTLMFWETQKNRTFNRTGSFDNVRVQISVLEGSTYNNTVIKLQIEKGTNATSWVEHKSQSYIMPIQQEMLEGDYIKDVEHHEWKKLVLTGDEDVSQDDIYQGIAQYSIPADGIFINDRNIRAISNCFKGIHWSNSWKINNSVTINGSGHIRFMTSQYTTVDSFKAFLKSKYDEGNPVIVYYKLAEPINLELTEEQREEDNNLNNLNSYSPQTNIYSKDNLTLINAKFLGLPSPYNFSKIYALGDIKNLIDVPNFNIKYEQQYFQSTNTNFILKPNFIYTLSFDYNVNTTSTDLYYSIGYGKNEYDMDLKPNIQYVSLTKGRNSVSFIVPEDVPADSLLWVRFVQTIILADVNVDISNVQLEIGNISTNYENPNLYNIYPTSVGKNLFDYNSPLYLLKNNAVYTPIQNGYNIKPVIENQDSYIGIGIKNILNQGDTYTISFSQLGQFEKFSLYTTEKGNENIISEISIKNNTFVAPDGIYDLQLVFEVDSSNTSNYIEIWNIQIEANNIISEYELHTSNSSVLTLDSQLNAVEEYRDLVCLESPNLLNPETQSGIVEGNMTYYLNQKGNTQYYIWYYNEDGNLITFIDEEGHESSGTTGIKGNFTTHKDCVKITITKTSNAENHDVTKGELMDNRVSITKGDNIQIYYPFITEPSLIKQIGVKELDGTEKWNKLGKVQQGYLYYVDNIIDAYTDNDNVYGIGLSTHFMWDYDGNIYPGVKCQANNGKRLYIGLNKDLSLSDFTEYIKYQYNKNTPIYIYYVLSTPEVIPLSEENKNALTALSTYKPISNIFTNNEIFGYLNLDYVSDYTEQQTQNAYVLLKCWNANAMPYICHSNYIDIPNEKDKVFIWMRRKNNLFDLKIENLGDYNEDDKPKDKTKPIVTLEIDPNNVEATRIPVIAYSIDDNGLKTVRFSKDNGSTWDEIITVDGLSSTNSYTFVNLNPNTTYTIRAEAIDLAGNIGGISQQVTTKSS